MRSELAVMLGSKALNLQGWCLQRLGLPQACPRGDVRLLLYIWMNVWSQLSTTRGILAVNRSAAGAGNVHTSYKVDSVRGKAYWKWPVVSPGQGRSIVLCGLTLGSQRKTLILL